MLLTNIPLFNFHYYTIEDKEIGSLQEIYFPTFYNEKMFNLVACTVFNREEEQVHISNYQVLPNFIMLFSYIGTLIIYKLTNPAWTLNVIYLFKTAVWSLRN